jgi:hypothetical protein
LKIDITKIKNMEKKILITRNLEGNEITHLNDVQLFMKPYVEEIMFF